MTNKLHEFIDRFADDESGSNAIEYGLIVGLISIAIVAGAGAAGTALGNIFTPVGTQIQAQATKIVGTS
jgi:pilus assembly protein Flp/PilA